jgi:dipeptidase E
MSGMKNIFLTSYIAGTIQQLSYFICKNQIFSKNILFITTAGNVEEYVGYMDEGKEAMKQMGFQLQLLDIAVADTQQCYKTLSEAEIICVAGGNTFYLLQELKRKKLSNLLVQKIENGCVYVGESAGAIILAADIIYVSIMDDRHKAPELDNCTALNVIDFYPLPHYIEEPFTDSVQKIYMIYKNNLKLVPINNQQSIIVDNNGYTIV